MELHKIIEVSVQVDRPLLLIGEHGTGKSYAIGEYAKTQKKTLHKITLTSEITPDDLVGTITLKDGTTSYEDRPLLQAVKNGEWIVLEELNASPASVLMLLNGLIESNADQRFISANGETLKPHKDFRLFATANPTKYAGTQQLNDALLSRFIVYKVEADYIPFLEMATKGKKAKIQEATRQLIGAIQKIKKDLDVYISPREVLTFAEVAQTAGVDVAKAVILSRFYDLEPDELKELATYLEVTTKTTKTHVMTDEDLKAEIEKATDGIRNDLNNAERNAKEMETYYNNLKSTYEKLLTDFREMRDKAEKAQQEIDTVKKLIKSATETQ